MPSLGLLTVHVCPRKNCDPSILSGEFLGPSVPKLETELKASSRALPAPGSKKLKSELKMEISTLFQLFGLFFDSDLTFWAPGPEGPGNKFSTPFPTLGPEGPRTPLGGLKGMPMQEGVLCLHIDKAYCGAHRQSAGDRASSQISALQGQSDLQAVLGQEKGT